MVDDDPTCREPEPDDPYTKAPRVPANMRGVKLLSVIGEQGWVEQYDSRGKYLGSVGPGVVFPPYTTTATRRAYAETNPITTWDRVPAIVAARAVRIAAGTLRDHARECSWLDCPGAGHDTSDWRRCLFLVHGKIVSREEYAKRVGWETP